MISNKIYGINASDSMYTLSATSSLWFDNRRVSKQGEVSLYLQVVINSKHLEVPLKLRWAASKIDLAGSKLHPLVKGDATFNDYNLIIERERSAHNEIFMAYRLRKEELTVDKFRRELRTFDKKDCFLTYMEHEALRRYQRKEIVHKSFQNANATRKCLARYDPDCLFKNIDKKWLKRYRLYMQNAGYKPGTIWSRISYTKAYLKLASLEPMLYVDAAVHDYPNPKPPNVTIYLNKDEITQLIFFLRSGAANAIETQVLKAFLFTCFTSLRISDVYRVASNWLINENFIQFIPRKNERKGKQLTIPILPMAKLFIVRQQGIYFELPTEQEYNRTLKDIARKAGIRKNLTSHVGRHTFGYLFMTTNGNIRALQEILGHSKLETTERYAHLDEEYKLNAVHQIQAEFERFIMKKAAD